MTVPTNTKTKPPYEVGFLDQIVAVHWPTDRIYVQLNATVNKWLDSATPAAPATATVTLFGSAKVIYTLPPDVFTQTNLNEQYFVYISPRQTQLQWSNGGVPGPRTPMDLGRVVGYDSFEDFLADYDGGLSVNGSLMQGIPPDGIPEIDGVPDPGFTDPMTPEAESIAFNNHVNSLPNAPDLGELSPYTALKSVIGYRSRPRSLTVTGLAVLISVPASINGKVASYTVNGFSHDDPHDGGNVAGFVYSTLEDPPEDVSALPYPADWEVIKTKPLSGTWTFSVSKPATLPVDEDQEGSGPYIISSPGFTGF